MVQAPGPGVNPNRHTLGRVIAAMLAVMCMTAAAAGCGQDTKARGLVSLLPSTALKGHSWEWTSACRVGPHTPAGCAASGPDLGLAQLAGNQWNLGGEPATAGSVRMSASSTGGLDLEGDLSSAPPCTAPACIAPQANTWVRGYPSILYGIDQCNAKTAPPQSPKLRLPIRVGAIPADLIGTAAYDATETSKVTYDVAYDMWLNASATKTPCRTNGTLEVMVWTDYDSQALLPSGMKVGTTTVPYAVNGATNPGDQAWSVYVNNVYGGGRTVPWGGTVWLVLDAAHTVKKGAVAVDLSAALAAVGTLVQNNYGWTDFANNYWLDTIAFGLEYGPQNGDPYGSGPTDFSLGLTSYCLEVRTTVSAAACG